MARHKNVDWNLPDKLEDWGQLRAALLMDIRDELQALRRIMECHNVRGGFEAMQRIDKRLKTKIKLR